jgi:hypothetical protein
MDKNLEIQLLPAALTTTKFVGCVKADKPWGKLLLEHGSQRLDRNAMKQSDKDFKKSLESALKDLGITDQNIEMFKIKLPKGQSFATAYGIGCVIEYQTFYGNFVYFADNDIMLKNSRLIAEHWTRNFFDKR